MSNHYKANIALLEASRLKLIQDNIAMREENERLTKQLMRLKAHRARAKAKAAPYVDTTQSGKANEGHSA